MTLLVVVVVVVVVVVLAVVVVRDVSRVRHCVLGRTRFPFGRIEYGTKGPIGRRKKIECLCKLRTSGKTCERRILQGN